MSHLVWKALRDAEAAIAMACAGYEAERQTGVLLDNLEAATEAIETARRALIGDPATHASGKRAIRFGSIWKHPKHGEHRVMHSLALAAGYCEMGKAGGWSLDNLRAEWTWVRDATKEELTAQARDLP